MKRVEWVAAAATVAAAFVLLSSHHRYQDEGRDLAYEEWISLQPSSTTPLPSVFAQWRRGFGQRALIKAIRDVAVANELAAALVNRVLYLRGQVAIMRVEELLESTNVKGGERRWREAA